MTVSATFSGLRGWGCDSFLELEAVAAAATAGITLPVLGASRAGEAVVWHYGAP